MPWIASLKVGSTYSLRCEWLGRASVLGLVPGVCLLAMHPQVPLS